MGGTPLEQAERINFLMGKSGNTELTLTANAGTTTLTDPRICATSSVSLSALTANAAAEIGAGTLYVSARADGSATITHANNAQTDRTFMVLIVN